MAEDFVSKVDNSPLAKILNGIIEDLPRGVGNLINKAGQAVAAVGDAALSVGSVFKDVKETFMGAAHSAAPSHEVGMARAPEVSVAQAPAVQKDAYSCTMNDVVCPVTPKINSNNVGIGV